MIPTTEVKTSVGRDALRSSDRIEPLAPLGSWQPVELIGEGTMAHVYRACPVEGPENRSAGYAVKVLRAEWQDTPAAVDLVRREALVGHTLSHPHVIPILDWGIKQPPFYVVMPHLSGLTLSEHLAGDRLPVLPAALWIARQVAQGLEALHAAGWIHADVKPSNIFVAPDGHAMLIDLGYARRQGQDGSVADRPIVGTLTYMAAEMFTSALVADFRSDIYSLGVTLYQMLTGRLPFEGRNPAEIAAMQREGVPDRLRCLAPTLPPPVVELVRQMLSREPLRRPQSARELVERLVALEIETFAERAPTWQ